jgi:hypothetical protein
MPKREKSISKSIISTLFGGKEKVDDVLQKNKGKIREAPTLNKKEKSIHQLFKNLSKLKDEMNTLKINEPEVENKKGKRKESEEERLCDSVQVTVNSLMEELGKKPCKNKKNKNNKKKNSNNNKYCSYCKIEGHTVKNCYKYKCKYCGKNNHYEDKCYYKDHKWERNNEPQKEIQVGKKEKKQKKKEEHVKEVEINTATEFDIKNDIDEEFIHEEPVLQQKCKYCKKKGHTFAQCPNYKCKYCGGNNHNSEECYYREEERELISTGEKENQFN